MIDREDWPVEERSLVVYRLRRHGVTLKRLAHMYGISPERVRQLIRKCRRREWGMQAAASVETPTSINEFPMTVRLYNCLRNAGIETAADYLSRNGGEIVRIKNLGFVTWREAEKLFAKRDVYMRQYQSLFDTESEERWDCKTRTVLNHQAWNHV